LNFVKNKQLSINTRYRGSKSKIIPYIWDTVKNFDFFSVLDCFGGTGAVSYMFKKMKKFVVYNDHLRFNHIIGKALIENSKTKLTDADVSNILHTRKYEDHSHIIENNFKEIYYTNAENIWLDRVIANIYDISNNMKRFLAFWCLFQACIIKRPFSLFHRKNLNIRTREVKRSFGNKTSWETTFDNHYRKFVDEINSYVFDSSVPCFSTNIDVLNYSANKELLNPASYQRDSRLGDHFDLVYIDPPYIPQKGENIIYRDLYHFLEGITFYFDWEQYIDRKSKHKRLKTNYNVWNDKKNVLNAFSSLVDNFTDSIIVISHRSDGLPSSDDLLKLLKKTKKRVKVAKTIEHKYALSHRNSLEIIIIAH
jgi:adenine-specific DNA methylase